MKPLDLKQRSFKADEITYLDRQYIQLDRMLLKFFEILRFDGREAIRRRRRQVDVEMLVEQMAQSPQRFPGFAAHPDVARAWLTNDLLDIMNRGKPGREAVVGPRPFHLNAFKLGNPKGMEDRGASKQVWAMLFHADRSLLTRLKEFFSRGVDPATDLYDGASPLDLETLAVLGLAAEVRVDHATTPQPDPIAPLCLYQGRVMADDLRRLLSYEQEVPRHVLAGYLRTVMGLHLSLLVLRLFRLLPVLVEQAQRTEASSVCPTELSSECLVTLCPYQLEIVADMTGDPTSPSARLAQDAAAAYLEGTATYARAVIVLNRIKDFAAMQAIQGRRPPARTVADLLEVLRNPPPDMEGFFSARIADLLTVDRNEDIAPMERDLVSLEGVSSFYKYVELACLQRLKIERKRVVDLFDSLAQKNRPGGLLRQTSGARTRRWFTLGSALLETLVQIAVVERRSDGTLRSRNILIDEFLEWLHGRYGIVIYAPAFRAVPPEEQEAWRLNERALRERLHQIGFFTDLSDAYNSQTLRPRYRVTADV